MSYDFLTMPRACDHTVAAERLLISGDNRTLYSYSMPDQRMNGPVNGANALRLSINGTVIQPNDPIYGYTVLPDEFTIAPDKRSKVVFNRQIRARALLIEAQYVTLVQACPKCTGKGVMLDYLPNNLGSFTRVTKRDKLIQRCLKYMLTNICAFYPTLTCRLKTFVGRKLGRSLTQDDIAAEVQNGLEAFKSVQGYQLQVQQLDPEEVLRSVDSVTALKDPNDPTSVRVKTKVSSPKGDNTSVIVGLKIAY